MHSHFPRSWLALPATVLLMFCSLASAQTELPGVTVTAPYTKSYGGYLISGNFRVDPRMPQVVFPADALVKDDILSVQPLRLADNEYLVVQECASADCRMAHIVRVWNVDGAVGMSDGNGPIQHAPDRIWIKHENKYFIWLQRMPEITRACDACALWFQSFQSLSPPMTLYPTGQEAAANRALLEARPPQAVPVVQQTHEGATFVVRFEGGATVRIRRMHAAG